MESRVRNRKPDDDVSAPPHSSEGSSDDVTTQHKPVLPYYCCQDHQAGESAVKCLFQGHKRMVRVGFELRLCRSQSRRSKHSTTMLTKQYLFVFYLVNFFPEHSLFLQCVHLLLAQSHFFHASVCKATSSNNCGS